MDKNEQLVLAAFEGDTALVERLLATRFLGLVHGADVNAQDETGYTALSWAAYQGHRDTVDSLLAKGADVNVQNRNSGTALSMAADQGHREIVDKLLAKGADVNVQSKYGITALMVAAAGGHGEIVDSLLAKGADVSIQDNDDETALILAADKGHREIVDKLLAKGADVSVQSKNGVTALIMAAAGGHGEIVDSLLAKGADVNVQSKNSGTALIRAASNGHQGIVDKLLAKGADVSIQSKKGNTALIVAADKGHQGIVDSLLAKGADVNVQNERGDTALIRAAAGGYQGIVDKLLAEGADVGPLQTGVFEWSGDDFVGNNPEWVGRVCQENASARSWFAAQGFPIPRMLGDAYAAEYCLSMARRAADFGILQEAWAGFHEALLRYSRLHDENNLALTCLGLGKVYGVRQDWRMAQLMFLQSAYLAKKAGTEEGYAWALFHLGDTTDQLGDKSLAILYTSMALPVFQRRLPSEVSSVQAALRRMRGT